jgi:hypothetical protein
MRLRLFVALACFYLLISSREPPWADSRVMYETAVALADRQALDIQLGGPAAFFTVRDGKKYGLYPLGNVITMIPGHLLSRALVKLPGAPVEALRIFTSHIHTSLLAAACCALFLGLARREGASTRTATLLALGLGLGTIIAVYARVSYSEALQAFLFVWIVGVAFRLAEKPTAVDGALAGFASGWLFCTKAVNVLALGVVVIYVVWSARRDLRRLLWPAVAAVAAFLPWAVMTLVVNRIKTGSFFDTGYTTAGGVGVFTGPVYPAVYGFLLSPGKGIFFNSPLLLLGLLGLPSYFRRSRARGVFLVAVILAVIGPHIFFPAWYGGWVWGPRYTVPVTPLMLLPAAPWLQEVIERGGLGRLRAAGLALLGTAAVAVQAAGCAFFWDFYVRMAIALRPAAQEMSSYISTVYVPQMSPIVMHSWLAWKKVRVGGLVLPPDPPFKSYLGHWTNVDDHWRVLNFDLWPKGFFGRAGFPGWGAAIAGVLGLGLVLGTWGVVRRWRAEDGPPAEEAGAGAGARWAAAGPDRNSRVPSLRSGPG